MSIVDEVAKRDGDDNCDVMKKVPDETKSGEKTTATAQGVRQGHTGDHVRYILSVSFIGAIVALSWLLLIQ